MNRDDEGHQPTRWLERVTKDQNISDLLTAGNNILSGARRWFYSRVLTPGIDFGYYDSATGRTVIGGRPTPGIQYNDTSIGADTLTCPAGHRYRVYAAVCGNVTSPVTPILSATIQGNAIGELAHDYAISNQPHVLVGGGAFYDGAGSAITIKELWLDSGDTATMTQTGFNVADDVEYTWLFEDYIL